MIFHPAIIALVLGSSLICCMLAFSAYYGIKIIRNWDIKSGSELQLDLERRTYLISTILFYSLGFQLLSLFLFIYAADKLSALFVGAMCAAGTLNVNNWGYPAAILKGVNSLLAGLWLILNYTDNRAYDYPLIKKKYLLLLIITPFIFAEAGVQAIYFFGLKPNIITSCCGTLFSSEIQGFSSGMAAFPRAPVEIAFFSSITLTFALGIFFYLKGKAAYALSLSGVITFLVSAIALISFLCVYFYELPTHHCPFCILQKEYLYVGYPVYLTLLCGAVMSMGVGAIMPFRKIGSLTETVPLIQRRLALFLILSYGLFMMIITYRLIFSNLAI